ncbi:MAG: hypothetical protein A2X86_04040 [Bdellovibrionales bacterium GWA2_49_15]|nr:MAG: hypothetical protein A2X86_04040 [Bdellovibrionales bacterium GWA2_49_15]HAZ12822.1 hypothetical protein [Bdellovibrionales bacterium]
MISIRADLVWKIVHRSVKRSFYSTFFYSFGQSDEEKTSLMYWVIATIHQHGFENIFKSEFKKQRKSFARSCVAFCHLTPEEEGQVAKMINITNLKMQYFLV